MTKIEIGVEVSRTRAGNDFGEKGKVVELTLQRARVYWPFRKLRTWIALDALKVETPA